jgi:prepilin peptidase CpaA
MMHTSAWTALWFLPFILPIAVWVSWSDMKFMKIPNKAVLALTLVFAVVGLIALPLDVWAWRWTHLAVILTAGFVASTAGLLGAGDAKFAAAMAPFFPVDDLRFVLALFAAAILGAFVGHRTVRAIGPVRSATADWLSWTHKDFPMGLALSGTLVIYFLAVLRLSMVG